MTEIKRIYLEGSYLEVGVKTLFILILIVAILYLIFTLLQSLTEINFKYKFSKKGIAEFKQNFKEFITDWIPIMLMTIGLMSIFIVITYIIGFIVKSFI